MDDMKDVLVPGRMIARNIGLYDTASEKKTEASEKAGAAAAASQAALDKKEDAADLLRKKRNAMFQTEGGSSGSGILSTDIGARDTYFGN